MKLRAIVLLLFFVFANQYFNNIICKNSMHWNDQDLNVEKNFSPKIIDIYKRAYCLSLKLFCFLMNGTLRANRRILYSKNKKE